MSEHKIAPAAALSFYACAAAAADAPRMATGYLIALLDPEVNPLGLTPERISALWYEMDNVQTAGEEAESARLFLVDIIKNGKIPGEQVIASITPEGVTRS
jgi:hypothetical protein